MNCNPTASFQEFDGINDITPDLVINMQAVYKDDIEILSVLLKKIVTVKFMCSPGLRINADLIHHGDSIKKDITLASNLKVMAIKL